MYVWYGMSGLPLMCHLKLSCCVLRHLSSPWNLWVSLFTGGSPWHMYFRLQRRAVLRHYEPAELVRRCCCMWRPVSELCQGKASDDEPPVRDHKYQKVSLIVILPPNISTNSMRARESARVDASCRRCHALPRPAMEPCSVGRTSRCHCSLGSSSSSLPTALFNFLVIKALWPSDWLSYMDGGRGRR